ncbi:hypothetical protein UT300005_05120 [Clostridium sp. CTA-5]
MNVVAFTEVIGINNTVKIKIKAKDTNLFILFFIILPPFRISVTKRINNMIIKSKITKELKQITLFITYKYGSKYFFIFTTITSI